jgi:hypothetical protein
MPLGRRDERASEAPIAQLELRAPRQHHQARPVDQVSRSLRPRATPLVPTTVLLSGRPEIDV